MFEEKKSFKEDLGLPRPYSQRLEHHVTETKVDDNKSQRHQISSATIMAEVSLRSLITDALSHPPSPPNLQFI